MNPKPRRPKYPPRPKPKRLLVRKLVTIVAGFIYSQGMLLCSDMEEGDGYSKKEVNKIVHIEGNGWQCDIGGSGPSAVLDLTYKKLKKEFLSYGSVEEIAAGHEESIRSEPEL
jgi:hypothetical protein